MDFAHVHLKITIRLDELEGIGDVRNLPGVLNETRPDLRPSKPHQIKFPNPQRDFLLLNVVANNTIRL